MVASFECQKRNTLQFLKRKIEAFFPYVLGGGTIGLIVTNLLLKSSIKGWVKSIADNVWSFLLIDFSGIRGKPVNGVTWYLSAMLLAMLILYPIMYKDKEIFLTVIAPAISLFLFGYLYQNFSNPRNPTQWIGFCYKGVIRAFAEICLGAICYMLSERLQKQKFTFAGHVFLSFIENTCYIIAFYAACTRKASRYDYLLILLFAIAICCSFSEKTFSYTFLSQRTANSLARFGFCLYLGHVYWARTLGLVFPALSDAELLAIYITCSLATAVLIHFLSGMIKKLVRTSANALLVRDC